jgi:hypothetical protein
MTDDKRRPSSTVALEPRRLNGLWWLIPARLRMPLLMWRTRRGMRAHRQALLREWRAQFPLVTPANCARVAKILSTRWDHTGTRLLGVPMNEFRVYAEQLLRTLSQRGPDAALACQLAAFEADLGLRNSPAAHRLSVAASIRAAVLPPVT